ncbi:MAG TPA: helix-turn-helix domain-containing protein [Devosiaceae bacterium]
MAETVRYRDAIFDTDFKFATLASGQVVKFTRTERAVLGLLTQRAGQVVSRDQLLDAASGIGSDARDRNIDFQINRLRRKLGDSAKAPQFIATRYGEGYVWVGRHSTDLSPAAGAFMVVGPVRGLAEAGARGSESAARIAAVLDRMTVPRRRVVFDPDCPPATDFVGPKPAAALSLDFLDMGEGHVDCTLTLRRFDSDATIRVLRLAALDAFDESELTDLAETLIDDVWRSLNHAVGDVPAPEDEPLPVRLHRASEMMASITGTTAWQDAERRLRSALARNPMDAAAKLMLATVLRSKYVMAGPQILVHEDPREEDEVEISDLVSAALPSIRGNGIFALEAARLIYHADLDAFPFAYGLAERAFRSTTAFATAFAIFGEFRMWDGEIEAALELYDRGMELAEPNSHFHYYLVVLKSQALVALNDRERAAIAAAPLCETEAGRRFYSVLFPWPDGHDMQAAFDAAMAQTSLEQARARILTTYYVSGRMFRRPEHRRNAMSFQIEQFESRMGPDVVPDEVRNDLAGRFPNRRMAV